MNHFVNCRNASQLCCNVSVHNNSLTQAFVCLCRMHFGGLGQLCDGVLGGDDFIQTKELRVWSGYDYLGWSREALGQGSVDIEFQFEKSRIFHNMQVGKNKWRLQCLRRQYSTVRASLWFSTKVEYVIWNMPFRVQPKPFLYVWLFRLSNINNLNALMCFSFVHDSICT